MFHIQNNDHTIPGEQLFDMVSPFFTITDPYKDLEAFMRLSMIATEHLPMPLRLQLLTFKKLSNANSYLLLKNLKQDPNLIKTPVEHNQASLKKTFYSEMWLSIFANMLGEPFSYQQESNGCLFHNVRPTKHNKHKLSSESSKILLDFHTETAFHPFLPDFLLLFCLRQDREKQAATILSSSRQFLPLLDNETVEILSTPQFKTGIDYSFGSSNGARGNGPTLAIFYGDKRDPLMTLDPDLMVGLTDEAQSALEKLIVCINKTKQNIYLQPGDCLIIDNRRAVHGRTQFTPHFDGYDRWLQRSYATRNLMASEILFSKRERILSYDFPLQGACA